MLLLFYNCEEKHKNMQISEGLTISIQIQTNSTARSITDSYKYIFRNLKLRPSYPSWMGFGHYEVNFLIAGPRTHPVPDVSNHSCPIDQSFMPHRQTHDIYTQLLKTFPSTTSTLTVHASHDLLKRPNKHGLLCHTIFLVIKIVLTVTVKFA